MVMAMGITAIGTNLTMAQDGILGITDTHITTVMAINITETIIIITITTEEAYPIILDVVDPSIIIQT